MGDCSKFLEEDTSLSSKQLAVAKAWTAAHDQLEEGKPFLQQENLVRATYALIDQILSEYTFHPAVSIDDIRQDLLVIIVDTSNDAGTYAHACVTRCRLAAQQHLSNLHVESYTSNVNRLTEEPDVAARIDQQLLGERIRKLLSEIAYHEREVIIRLFGLDGLPPRPWREVGKELGIEDKRRLERLELRALAKLRHPTRSCWLKEFL